MKVILVEMRDRYIHTIWIAELNIFSCHSLHLFNGDILCIVLVPGEDFMGQYDAILSFAQAQFLIFLELFFPLPYRFSFEIMSNGKAAAFFVEKPVLVVCDVIEQSLEVSLFD